MSALQEFLEQAEIIEMDTAHKGLVAFSRPFVARVATDIRDMAALVTASQNGSAQSDTMQALIEAGGALEQVKAMIEYYFIDHNPNTTAKQTPFTAAAMIYAVVCDSLSRPVLAGLLAKE